MKKILMILLLVTSFIGCKAQSQVEFNTVSADFTVIQLTKETATLSNDKTSLVYEIDIIDNLEKETEYRFILDVATGQEGRIRQATVLFHRISQAQVGRDIAEAELLFKQRVKKE